MPYIDVISHPEATIPPFYITKPVAILAEAIIKAGGTPVAVGGCVRDCLLGTKPKDVDIEVYEMTLDDLEICLQSVGRVHAVGRAFGVLKVYVEVNEPHADDPSRIETLCETIDVALPRRENKQGQGHRGFVVESDGFMDFATAALRRDFTVNAMGIDLKSRQLLDPWGGVADLRACVLRHVSTAFDEDPLRVLRACQFAARFSFDIHPDTIVRCLSLQKELPTLPVERLWEELRKLLKAPWPSVGLAHLRNTGALILFPELAALVGCQQEPEWHPEGDVWIHTLMVVDEAAQIARDDALSEDETLILLLAALCHDLGKPATTAWSDGRWRSLDHEQQGERPTRAFLQRVGAPPTIVEAVVPLVREHLKPFQLYQRRSEVTDSTIRRLALRVDIPRLARIARADHFGRTTAESLAHDDGVTPWLLEKARALAVENQKPTPILLGRHVLAAGIKAGPRVGQLTKAAFEAQLDGVFADEAGAVLWLQQQLQN